MSAIRLRASDYKYLMDRGWRRSGTYCYKLLSEVNCCPSYTIRCNALAFRLSKSQKRVLKDMNLYLKHGKINQKNRNCQLQSGDLPISVELEKDYLGITSLPNNVLETNVPRNVVSGPSADCSGDKASNKLNPCALDVNPKSNLKQSKARVRRWNAKMERFKKRSLNEKVSFDQLMLEYRQRRAKRLEKNTPKTLEDYFESEPKEGEGKSFLEVRLVSTSGDSDEFHSTLTASHNVYQRYQLQVHQDTKDDCNLNQFTRFLVKSPIVYESTLGDLPAFGSYHQQYWLNGKTLIAVGVVDIVPNCLSSVYAYYDPNFAFLHLGIYLALREIAFVRHLHRVANNKSFQFYYMGYYIHSCPKMAYKANYKPSYLACPESYAWCPISECIQALTRSASGYTRFSLMSVEDKNRVDKTITDEELDRKILLQLEQTGRSTVMSLARLASCFNPQAVEMLRCWARLIGQRAITGNFLVVVKC